MNYNFNMETLLRLLSIHQKQSPNRFVSSDPDFVQNVWTYFQVVNPGGGNPYHNNLHTQWVVCDLVRFYLMTGVPVFNIPAWAIIGAMYHDFGHSAGRTPDSENIRVAVSEVEEFFSDRNPAFVSRIVELIKSTEFANGGWPSEVEGQAQAAMRHADLSTIFHVFSEPELTLKQYAGLATEIGREFNLDFLYENRDFLEDNKKYMHPKVQDSLPKAFSALFIAYHDLYSSKG